MSTHESIEYNENRVSDKTKTGERGRMHYGGMECTSEVQAIIFRARENGINQNVLLDTLVRLWGIENLPELKATKHINNINLKTVFQHINGDSFIKQMKAWYPEDMATIAPELDPE